ncbi:MAG: FAD-binding oxidoreductase [Rhodocyclaceae bacterium]|jgi:toluene monooxygenase electron transfer component|nr:FAD-binding oxidoreductase [Rhodocyclaceae bacterium]
MTDRFHIKLAGGNVAFDCASDDTLLRGGLRQGLGLAYECNVGACGSCKFDLVDGEVDDLFPAAPGLKPKERERGKRLACQCVPRSDCTIKIRSGEEYVSDHVPRKMQARLIAKRALTHDISEFSFATGEAAQFLPGQYALLRLEGIGQARAYSMSNLANADGTWQFIIRKVPAGIVSNALFDTLQVGSELELDGPYGIAYLRPQIPRPIVCIAGGSGLAPVLSIIRGTRDAGGLRGIPQLLYGGRGPGDIPDIAAMLSVSGVEAGIHPVVSMPELAPVAAWSGDVGFVHEFVPKKLGQPLTAYEYYLAGPPPMIEACVRMLVAEHNVPSTQIHFDRFF